MFKRLISFTGALLLSWGSQAADTDIFEPNPITAADRANVLILIDNSANWDAQSGGTTKKVLIHEALYKVIMSMDNDSVNLGIGIFADSGTGTKETYAGEEGNKLINRIENLDATLKDTYAHLLYNNADDLTLKPELDINGEIIGYTIDGFIADQEALPKANNAPYAMSMSEARLYFGGLTPEADKVLPWDKYALGDDQSGDYVSPINSSTACAGNYIILLANGSPDSGENKAAQERLTAYGANTDKISLENSKYETNWADEFARYMSTSDMNDPVLGTQNVFTHVIDIYDVSTLKGNNKPGSNTFEGARDILQSIAVQGKGDYYTATNSNDVVEALQNILDKISDQSSVFAASALPVSVNTRGTNLNQVYMGVFQPDADRQPRWYGNLKAYKIGRNNTGGLELVDQDDRVVRDSSRGFVNSDVESFWTSDSDFFSYSERGDGGASDLPDGEFVEKGGVAQQIRSGYSGTSNTGRKLYTCVSCSSSLETFNSTTTGLSTTLVEWVYGENNASQATSLPDGIEFNNTDEGTATVRASVHGDVLHSQPAAINYDKDSDIVVFYGANDGVFRAVKGGLTESGAGTELWGFIPGDDPDYLNKLETLRTNEGSSDFGSPHKPWFIDGDITSYFEDTNSDGSIQSGEKAYLYLTMRRGGQSIYGLDVTTPTSPKMLFDPIKSGDTGFEELGQTWSGIEVTHIAGYDNPVLVFGGGYDEDADDIGPDSSGTLGSPTTSAGTASVGRAIYVVDAITGNLVASIGPSAGHTVTEPDMKYSIPGRIAVLDINNNGFADRFYAADTGGNIWRVDTENDPTPANWKVTHFADVSDDSDGNSTNDGRKFLYRVDVVSAEDNTGDYHAVLIGSGDREHPFDTGVKNYMYMFKDRYTNLTSSQLSPITMSSLYDATDNLIQQGSDPAAEIALLDTAEGWFIKLGVGEKTVSHVTSLAGVAYFNTNQPDTSSNSCNANLGIARIYQISVTNATAVTENNQIAGLTLEDRNYEVPGGGYPPPPVHVIVEVDGELVEAIISGTEVNESQSELNKRTRTFWSKQIDD